MLYAVFKKPCNWDAMNWRDQLAYMLAYREITETVPQDSDYMSIAPEWETPCGGDETEKEPN